MDKALEAVKSINIITPGQRSDNFKRNFSLFNFHFVISRELFHELQCDYVAKCVKYEITKNGK